MTVTPSPTARPDGDLVVVIRNAEPLGVEAVARLLTALGEDYRASSGGRTLAVREIRSGSLIIHLWDAAQPAVAVMAAAVTLVEFSKLLRSALDATRKGRAVGSRSRGMKTVRALIETARQSHADVEILYQGRGERIQVTLSRPEAEEITLRDDQSPREERSATPTARPLPTPRVDQEIEAFARSAEADLRLLGARADDGLQVLLRVLVQAVTEAPGGRQRIISIAERLRANGDTAAADFLQAIMDER